ncbi:mannose-1-phosphate guanylyltransferase/mannose-6-phosphate isomerase [Oleiphilus sp. HI0125]|uniref:mannose-1-phosphate guanylyltransferase/mannose-6-phosphate isomerase n=3 Tax=Oleiphilus sp. HI0125 TaxID=1822266 RepID=UPI0007C359E7|nr:mannose-1-phosphate guanylyltransferase/mannose-6-phosphate isomerase [Oleiphilus sp. HI0125]KZZ58203.1 mannose-1-phosphate guanylyltransferase/mannose-6-phosphate isomerase [Oleiphilus sp. HI0125]
MQKVVPVVMAGGSGTRLWPLSRKLFPKQFLPLMGEQTMLQDTLSRLGSDAANPIVVCNDEHRFNVAEQLRQQGQKAANIILEPIGRNTAPAVALSSYAALSEGADPILLVLAADHVIRDEKAFQSAVQLATASAELGKLVTFGIVPRSPETGYGYIKASTISADGTGDVEQFVEKPDLETAQSYLADGNYLWNSGMFMFKASVFLEELEKFRPDIAQATKAAFDGRRQDLDFTRLDEAKFEACPDESIDYAIMEKTEQALVVSLDAGWSDVGSWSSLWEESEQDEDGNSLRGDVLAYESKNNLLFSDHKLIATVGVENLVVVDTPDAVLVSTKDKVQDVKKVVDRLKQEGRSEATIHREVMRPWGFYDSIDKGERFQVKRITVNPGEKLSLQMHHHRAEHWIVVSGTALVTINDETKMVSENQSTYIPIGATHRLENPGVLPLEMIEVQSGSYLGEDDIVRFEDTYGRE